MRFRVIFPSKTSSAHPRRFLVFGTMHQQALKATKTIDEWRDQDFLWEGVILFGLLDGKCLTGWELKCWRVVKVEVILGWQLMGYFPAEWGEACFEELCLMSHILSLSFYTLYYTHIDPWPGYPDALWRLLSSGFYKKHSGRCEYFSSTPSQGPPGFITPAEGQD